MNEVSSAVMINDNNSKMCKKPGGKQRDLIITPQSMIQTCLCLLYQTFHGLTSHFSRILRTVTTTGLAVPAPASKATVQLNIAINIDDEGMLMLRPESFHISRTDSVFEAVPIAQHSHYDNKLCIKEGCKCLHPRSQTTPHPSNIPKRCTVFVSRS